MPDFLHIIIIHTKLQIIIFKSHKNNLPISFLIWNTNNAHLDLHFPKGLRNSKKIEKAM